jgi:hypothetical protein
MQTCLLVAVDRQSITIGQSGGMGQQVADLDRARHRHRDKLAARRSIRTGGNGHLGRLETWDVLRNRIVQQEFPLFVEDHDGNRGDRLAHGRDSENGIGGHRTAGFLFHPAIGLMADRLAVAQDVKHATCQVALVDVPLNQTVESFETRDVESRDQGRVLIHRS